MATRYNTYDSRSSTSSHFSDPSSSIDLNSSASSRRPKSSSSSKAIVKSKPLDVNQGSRVKNQAADLHLTTFVKKFMDKKSANKITAGKLFIPSDIIAEDLKKTAKKGTAFTALQRKLFSKGYSNKDEKKEVKALTEVKGNTRTLAMVLRSERELLSANKEIEMEVSQLKLLLQDKNVEVEKLKDLCLKQREEIKSLKSAILFPEVMNSQLQNLVEKQSSELTQAKQLIPTLQRQFTSLTGQLQCLAQDLAEVKAEKFSSSACHQQQGSYLRSLRDDRDEPSDSLEFSSCGDPTSPGSPEDLFLEDLNPCLTPYYVKTKSREFDEIQYNSIHKKALSEEKKKAFNELGFSICSKKLSKSSDRYRDSNKVSSTMAQTSRRSDESKGSY